MNKCLGSIKMEKISVIFIAAGMGSRLSPYTDNCPKCMLPLNGKPIIFNNIDALRHCGVDEINVIIGYQKESIKIEGATYFENDDFENNNILFSLMYAADVFQHAIDNNTILIISYSDIIYSAEIVQRLLSSSSDIALAVDTDWLKLYEGRSEHPVSEAEKVVFDTAHRISKLGKLIEPEKNEAVGEFIGLLKLTPAGARNWLSLFNELKASISPLAPFMGSPEFRKSYLTHFLQAMISRGMPVSAVTFDGGWMEFDTAQDYEKLLSSYQSEAGNLSGKEKKAGEY